MMHGATEGLDAGASGPSEPLMLEMMLRLALPSRMGICMTRERLRFALGSGELDALARDVVAGRVSPNKQGVAESRAVPRPRSRREASRSTRAPSCSRPRARCASRGDRAETCGCTFWAACSGATRTRPASCTRRRRSALGTSTRAKRSRRAVPGPRREGGEQRRNPSYRYLLSCFTVINHLAPRLLEVGAAPD